MAFTTVAATYGYWGQDDGENNGRQGSWIYTAIENKQFCTFIIVLYCEYVNLLSMTVSIQLPLRYPTISVIHRHGTVLARWLIGHRLRFWLYKNVCGCTLCKTWILPGSWLQLWCTSEVFFLRVQSMHAPFCSFLIPSQKPPKNREIPKTLKNDP